MRRLVLAVAVAGTLAGCGGESAAARRAQTERQIVARCEAEALKSAKEFVAGLPGQNTPAAIQKIADPEAQGCIDSGGKEAP